MKPEPRELIDELDDCLPDEDYWTDVDEECEQIKEALRERGRSFMETEHGISRR